MVKKSLFKKLIIIVPSVVFLSLFAKYFLGKAAMTTHGMDYYLIIKYYMENFSRGVFPLWDPFVFWGKPDSVNARFIGEYNPFLWIYPLATGLGVPRPVSFLVYATSYYFLGLAGFYLLAKRLFKETFWAALSFVLLMFSSLYLTIFNNYCITLLAIPMIWFFYFLVAFFQKQQRGYFLGIVFSLMIILITYMPFYFLTIFGLFSIGFVVLFFSGFKKFLWDCGHFIRRHKLTFLFGLLGLGVAVIPGLLWYLGAGEGDYILSWRHAGSADGHTASMSLATINASSMIGGITFRNLFSGLAYSNYLVFYVSIFVYIILILSIITRISRRLILLSFVAVSLFFIAMADLTPVHKFLYDTVYFFRLFRNLIYLVYFIIPFFLLFFVDQLKEFMAMERDVLSAKRASLLFVIVAHALFFVFLNQFDDVIISSYVTVFLSMIVFGVYVLGGFEGRRPLLFACILAVAMVHPIEFFSHYVKNSPDVIDWAVRDRFVPDFLFVRPSRESRDLSINRSALKIAKSPSTTLDDSGFEDWKYDGLKRSYVIQRNISGDVLEKFVRHKFIVYDHAQIVQYFDSERFSRLAENFKLLRNQALFYDVKGSPSWESSNPPVGSTPRFITKNTDDFEVVNFDLNFIRLRTNFSKDKFLVYNDSFYKNWRAWLNGRSVPIYRANYAFKGLYLPGGKNEVYLRYGTPWSAQWRWAILVFFNMFLLVLMITLYRESKIQMK